MKHTIANDYTKLINDVADFFYPKNTMGYNDPNADYDEFMKAIDEFIAEVKNKWVNKKETALCNQIRNLETWLDGGVTKDGKPIDDKKRKWATGLISKAKEEVCKLTDGRKYGKEIAESYEIPE